MTPKKNLALMENDDRGTKATFKLTYSNIWTLWILVGTRTYGLKLKVSSLFMTVAKDLLLYRLIHAQHSLRTLYMLFTSLGLATPPISLGTVAEYSIGLGARVLNRFHKNICEKLEPRATSRRNAPMVVPH